MRLLYLAIANILYSGLGQHPGSRQLKRQNLIFTGIEMGTQSSNSRVGIFRARVFECN